MQSWSSKSGTIGTLELGPPRGVTTTSADKLPGTCTRVPDVPVAKVEDLWTDMDR